MSYRYGYALEKFSRAVYILATGEDEIRRRLLLVFEGELLGISPEYLPPQLRDDYRWIWEQVTKYDEKYRGENDHFASLGEKYEYLKPTKLQATLSRIRRATGAKVARKISHIWSVLEEEESRM